MYSESLAVQYPARGRRDQESPRMVFDEPSPIPLRETDTSQESQGED